MMNRCLKSSMTAAATDAAHAVPGGHLGDAIDVALAGWARVPVDTAPASPACAGVDRFADEQMFEEDVRTVLSMMRPHRRERLLGWNEYRTGGAHFRATISWDPALEQSAAAGTEYDKNLDRALSVPRLTDVLESILVGSVRNQDELQAAEEFEIYRGVVRELYRRLDEMQSCYE
jgi:hypothetical protein